MSSVPTLIVSGPDSPTSQMKRPRSQSVASPNLRIKVLESSGNKPAPPPEYVQGLAYIVADIGLRIGEIDGKINAKFPDIDSAASFATDNDNDWDSVILIRTQIHMLDKIGEEIEAHFKDFQANPSEFFVLYANQLTHFSDRIARLKDHFLEIGLLVHERGILRSVQSECIEIAERVDAYIQSGNGVSKLIQLRTELKGMEGMLDEVRPRSEEDKKNSNYFDAYLFVKVEILKKLHELDVKMVDKFEGEYKKLQKEEEAQKAQEIEAAKAAKAEKERAHQEAIQKSRELEAQRQRELEAAKVKEEAARKQAEEKKKAEAARLSQIYKDHPAKTIEELKGKVQELNGRFLPANVKEQYASEIIDAAAGSGLNVESIYYFVWFKAHEKDPSAGGDNFGKIQAPKDLERLIAAVDLAIANKPLAEWKDFNRIRDAIPNLHVRNLDQLKSRVIEIQGLSLPAPHKEQLATVLLNAKEKELDLGRVYGKVYEIAKPPVSTMDFGKVNAPKDLKRLIEAIQQASRQ